MNLELLHRRATERKLSFLLVGGHAVIAHGYPRSTFDLDVLVSRSEIDEWSVFLKEAGYSVHQEGATFKQYNPPDSQSQPVDLMIVGQDTFRKFQDASDRVAIADIEVRVACLKHLLALKAHAIRHGHPGRVEKDMDDVIALLRINRIDVSEPQWQELLTQYGPSELYDKLLRIQKQS